jgi:hypothetical protein
MIDFMSICHDLIILTFYRIIAVMLGRLEMDVDECIDAYTSMFGTVFGKKSLPVDMFGRIKGRFDSVILEDCVKKILKKRGLKEDEPFLNAKEKACRVYVYPDPPILVLTINL